MLNKKISPKMFFLQELLIVYIIQFGQQQVAPQTEHIFLVLSYPKILAGLFNAPFNTAFILTMMLMICLFFCVKQC
jgi:hypothetical protein